MVAPLEAYAPPPPSQIQFFGNSNNAFPRHPGHAWTRALHPKSRTIPAAFSDFCHAPSDNSPRHFHYDQLPKAPDFMSPMELPFVHQGRQHLQI
jgi:hypothetical protein